MAKEAYFFSHDSNARTDPKIMAMIADYKTAGYGLYWAIIEMLREQDGFRLKHGKITYNAIAMQMLCERITVEEYVDACVKEYELLASDGEYFWSESLLKRMKIKEEKSKKAAESANARWNKKEPKSSNNEASEEQGNNESNEEDANALQLDSDSNANKGKKKKINKIKYADYVSMTEDEHNKLIADYGEIIIKNKITDLNLWKGSKGKKTKSDYMTILAWIRKDNIKPNQQMESQGGTWGGYKKLS